MLIGLTEKGERHAACEHADAAAHRRALERAIVERKARLEHILAVECRLVGKAIACLEERVQRGHISGTQPFIAQAEQQRELAGGLPLILKVKAVLNQCEIGRRVKRIAGDRPCHRYKADIAVQKLLKRGAGATLNTGDIGIVHAIRILEHEQAAARRHVEVENAAVVALVPK